MSEEAAPPPGSPKYEKEVREFDKEQNFNRKIQEDLYNWAKRNKNTNYDRRGMRTDYPLHQRGTPFGEEGKTTGRYVGSDVTKKQGLPSTSEEEKQKKHTRRRDHHAGQKSTGGGGGTHRQDIENWKQYGRLKSQAEEVKERKLRDKLNKLKHSWEFYSRKGKDGNQTQSLQSEDLQPYGKTHHVTTEQTSHYEEPGPLKKTNSL